MPDFNMLSLNLKLPFFACCVIMEVDFLNISLLPAGMILRLVNLRGLGRHWRRKASFSSWFQCSLLASILQCVTLSNVLPFRPQWFWKWSPAMCGFL